MQQRQSKVKHDLRRYCCWMSASGTLLNGTGRGSWGIHNNNLFCPLAIKKATLVRIKFVIGLFSFSQLAYCPPATKLSG